jgi:hypothetical protein
MDTAAAAKVHSPNQQQQQPLPLLATMATQPQTEQHTALRKEMAKNIAHLLQQRKPAPDPSKPVVVDRLQEMVTRLEDYLWKRSASVQEYSNLHTLKHRLQSLAAYMGKHQQQRGETGGGGSDEAETVSKDDEEQHHPPTTQKQQPEMLSTSSSSKRVCVRAPTEIGADEWSHVHSFLYNDAFESACDLANMSKVCRSWREVVTWSEWSKAFGFFPLGKQFPAVLVPIMECARKNGETELEKRRSNVSYSSNVPWGINRFAAKEHLGLSAKSWRALKDCEYDTSRKAGDKHLYKVGDILREASSSFASIAALEKRVHRIAVAKAAQEKKVRLMGERHVQVADFLRSIGGECFAEDGEIRGYITGYIYEGSGIFAEICKSVWEKRRAKDDENAREVARAYQKIELEQRRLADSRARMRANKRMGEERLVHVNAFLQRIGLEKKLNYTGVAFVREGAGTFEDLCMSTLSIKHLKENEIATKEDVAYLEKGGDRRIYVSNFLNKIGGEVIIYDDEVQAYIMDGGDTFEEFTKTVLERKRAKDRELLKEACVVYRRLMGGRAEAVFMDERAAHLDRGDKRRTHVAAFLKTIGRECMIHESGVKQYILNGEISLENFREQMVKMKSAKGEEIERKLLGMGPLDKF